MDTKSPHGGFGAVSETALTLEQIALEDAARQRQIEQLRAQRRRHAGQRGSTVWGYAGARRTGKRGK